MWSFFRFLTVSLALGATCASFPAPGVRAEEDTCAAAADTGWEQPFCQDCRATCWTIRAGAICLEPVHVGSVPLVSDGLTLATVLDATSFDYGYKPGFEVSLLRQGVGNWDLELRYLQNDAGDARASAVWPAAVQINTLAPTGVGIFGPVTIDAAYRTTLYNGEFNLRRIDCRGLTWIAGLRFLDINERLDMAFADPGLGNPVQSGFHTQNHLYGSQFGLEKMFGLTERLELGCSVKGGLFWNHATQASVIDYGAFADSVSAKRDGVSLLSEASLSLNYRVSPALSLCSEYRVLSVGQVARAADQVAASDFTAFPPTATVNRGDMFYHGAFLGLEYRR